MSPAGYAQAVRLLASGDLPGTLPGVRMRPGFIIGAQDRVTPMEQTQAAASAWEAAHGQRPRIIEINDAGHAVYVQQPAGFAAAMLTLFGLDARTGQPEQREDQTGGTT